VNVTGSPAEASLAVRLAGALVLGLIVAIGSAAALDAAHGFGAERLLILLVIAPWAEEAVFRAGLQEALARHLRSPWMPVVLTAIAFGLAHALMRGDPAAFAVALPALAIGALYRHRRRVSECAALHTVFNALWLAWALAAA
jgi:membrane protease YdiL (CAAX protease family)